MTAKLFDFTGITTLNIDPDRVLEQAKGNLQRSRWYTNGTFIDYRSGSVRLITG